MDLPHTKHSVPDGLALQPRADWRHRTAHYVSILFSPPLTLLTAVILIVVHLPSPETRLLAGWYAAFVLLTPLLFIAWLKRRGWVSDFDLSVRQERIAPMLLAWLGLLAGWLALQRADAPRLLLAFALLHLCQGAIFVLITLFWKISLHTTAVASLTTLWWAITGSVFLLWLALPLIFLVAWSRVRLGRHTTNQTLAGTLLGTLACLLVWQFYGV